MGNQIPRQSLVALDSVSALSGPMTDKTDKVLIRLQAMHVPHGASFPDYTVTTAFRKALEDWCPEREYVLYQRCPSRNAYQILGWSLADTQGFLNRGFLTPAGPNNPLQSE